MYRSRDINIRPIREGKRLNVETIVRRAFPLVERWFFEWMPDVLVVEQEDQLLGLVVSMVDACGIGTKSSGG